MSSARQSKSGGAGGGSASKRLIRELGTWDTEKSQETGIERLGLAGEEDLFVWEAVLNGKGIGHGYDCESIISGR